LEGNIPVVNIDHHVTNVNFGRVNVVRPDASACAEVVGSIIDLLAVPLNKAMATHLMTGLVGDTRGFATSSVTPGTLRMAARLLEAGADLTFISEQIMGRHSLDTLQAWGVALSGMHVEGNVIWAVSSANERKRAGIREVIEAGLSSLLLSVPDANIAAVFTEKEDGAIDVSMRARPGFDVAKIALHLGGGGHPQAAGCMISGPLEEAVSHVLALLTDSMNSDRGNTWPSDS
jgi:phosphoesterase RecJ-like protein